MDLDVLFLLVLAGIVLVVLSRVIDEPSRAVSGMWRYVEAVWPSGVQEDDDAHWSWARARVARKATTEPEIVEDDDEVELPDVGQVRYDVRSADYRSVDRAKS